MRASNHASLHKQLTSYFSLDEVRTLCLHLGVSYDSLAGENTIDAKARELIMYMRRQGRLAELEAYIAQERPNIREIKMPTTSVQINIKKISISLLVTLSLAVTVWWVIGGFPPSSPMFELQVLVQDSAGLPIVRAQATLLVGGSTAPLVVYSDKSGLALFQLSPDLDGKSAVLRITQTGYATTEQHINLNREILPIPVELTQP